MASAQFVSNVGSWMQTVGARELMLTLTTSATLVALIQTAAGLPVVLLAVPAGAIGDLVDRRRLLIASQSFMLVAAAVLAGLALAGLVTPWVLLLLIFAVGVGQTLTSPTWQTLQPELVAPEDRTQAIALGAVNQNLSRAVGPAFGGALFAATSAGALFVVNAVSFVPVIGAVARWRSRARAADVGRVLEQFVVGSWDEHLRQHERVSRRDQLRLDQITAMTDPNRPATVTHWLAPEPGGARAPSNVVSTSSRTTEET